MTMSPSTDLGQMLLVSYNAAMSSGGDVVKGLRPPYSTFFSFFTAKVYSFVFSFSVLLLRHYADLRSQPQYVDKVVL